MRLLKSKKLWIAVAVVAVLIGGSNLYFRVLHPDAELVAAAQPDGDTYPAALANAPQDSTVDPWGMDNRECVSYVAWMVHQTYNDMPYWYGAGADAKNWPKLAQSSGFNVSSIPKVGDVAIQQPTGAATSNSSPDNAGHAMWVQQVDTDGTIVVSQYNGNSKSPGTYSISTVPAAGLQFINFGQKQ